MPILQLLAHAIICSVIVEIKSEMSCFRRYGRNFPKIIKRSVVDIGAENRIINGDDAPRYPWVVRISCEASDNPLCSGTLLSISWIITAKICVSRTIRRGKSVVPPKDIKAIADAPSDGASATGCSLEIEQIHHQDNSFHALALLKVANAPTTGEFIHLPEPGFVQEGLQGNVAGWGNTEFNGRNFPTMLRKTSQTIHYIKLNECPQFSLSGEVESNIFCALNYGSYLSAGDQGAGLIHKGTDKYILLGILIAPGGVAPSYLHGSLFTNISRQLGWIAAIRAR